MNTMSVDLSRFARFPLLEGKTPIQRLERLSRQIGDVSIYVKRDDLMGVGGGGNKLRKLEFLIGECIAQHADTIITVGARQSNHARLTAAAAARAGIQCELVLTRTARTDDAFVTNGNVLLDELFGATIHDLAQGENALAFAQDRAAQLSAQGRRVYVCPLGGSSPVGCLGYAACAAEIEEQAVEYGITFDQVVVPHGSGGTHAGLIAGFVAAGRAVDFVRAHAVLADEAQSRAASAERATAALALMGSGKTIDANELDVTDASRGDAYGVPTDAMRKAVHTMANQEGLLLDPVYSGKAFAGLLHDVRSGRYRPGQNVLFVMTGGVPGLFAYRSAF